MTGHPPTVESGVRRLAALLLTDMVGYVSLTQQNELLALRLLEAHAQMVRPVFERHGGHVVKTIGDAFLAEFDSALAAAECAIELQRLLHDAERTSPGESVRIRIGLHVGDVVHRDHDVFGDAVNLLSRITPLADPGGICLTEPVLEQVRQRIDFACHPIEIPPLRHVEFPISVSRVELPWLEEARGFRSPWTDRHRELELLEQALTRAVNGESVAIFLEGEAGIGKTRLAEEVLRRAREHGFRILRGGFVGELSAPYSAWAAGLREFVGEAPAPLLYKVLGAYSAELSKLIPELQDRVGPVSPAVVADPDLGRQRLFDGVAHLLQALSRESPVLVFLDDLHCADDASLHLMRHVIHGARSQRLLLLGAFRDTEVEENAPLREALVDLGREHLVSSLHLERFGPEDVRRLVDANYGGPEHDPDLANAVLDRTGGNPFFVEELVRSLSERDRATPGPLRAAVSSLPWPETVRRVLRQRLLRLPTETVRLLEVAAVLGPSFRCDVLGEVAETDEEKLLEALEGALRVRILTEVRRNHGPLACGFSDRQTRDLLYRDLSQIRARRYHRRAAEVLERQYGAQAKEHAEELAYHCLAGELGEKALEYTLTAAKRAADLYAREAAIEHYRTALDLIDEHEPGRLAPVLEALAEQELFSGEVEGCRRHFDESARRYEESGDRSAAARLWLRAGRIYRWAFYDLSGATACIERARRCLEGLPESGPLASLNAELAGQLAQNLDYPSARQELQRALAMAERADDESAAESIRLSLLGLAGPGEIDATRRTLIEEIEPELARNPRPEDIRSVYSLIAEFVSEVDGNARDAVAYLEKAVGLLRARGAISSAVDLAGQDLAATYLVLGEVAEARRLAEEGYDYGVRNYPTPDAPTLAVLGEIARLDGDWSRSEELFDRAASLLDRTGARGMLFWVESLHLRLEIDQGAFAAAAARVARLRHDLEGREPLPMFSSTSCRVLDFAVRANVGIDNLSTAHAYLEVARRIVHTLPIETNRAYLARSEGALALAEGDPRRAAERYRDSAEVFGRLGWRYEESETWFGLAAASEAAGSRAEAAAAWYRANELRQRCGLSPRARPLGPPLPA